MQPIYTAIRLEAEYQEFLHSEFVVSRRRFVENYVVYGRICQQPRFGMPIPFRLKLTTPN